jgi:TetR/AcrR family transcriptional repressor of nem operon
MKVNREQFAENRRKILDAAGALFRARGFDAVTVADVMKAAGLTHGGFYGHFKSKDNLIAQTLSHVIAGGESPDVDWDCYMAGYLSRDHRDNLKEGCPVAALGAEAIRQGPAARAALTAGLRHQIDARSGQSADVAPDAAREAAIGTWAAMIGAMILSRLVDDPTLSDELLAGTHSWIVRNEIKGEAAASKLGKRK